MQLRWWIGLYGSARDTRGGRGARGSGLLTTVGDYLDSDRVGVRLPRLSLEPGSSCVQLAVVVQWPLALLVQYVCTVVVRESTPAHFSYSHDT
jgi:hypothetical protein